MKVLTAAMILTTATAIAQTPSDCRTQPAPTTPCIFAGTNLGTQLPIGKITLQGQQAGVFEPLPVAGGIAPAVKGGHHIELSGYYTMQSQFLSYQDHNSDGYKVSVSKQWNDLVGIDVRGAVIRYDLLRAGKYAGNNHTYSIAFGPRVQHSFGRVTPYGEFLIGAVEQFEPGMNVSGVAGVKVKLSKHVYWTPVDAEYRYALMQTASKDIQGRNPLRGRVEASTGLTFRF